MTALPERAPRVLIAAGEVSGDQAGAAVARELARRIPGCRIFGLGGTQMAGAGVDLAYDISRLACVGVTEALAVLPRLAHAMLRLERRIRKARPDVAVLIAADVTNIILARRLRAAGIPTLTYFPPVVWIWGAVARPIARSYDLILASFPDEARVYGGAGGRVVFLGHHLADTLAPVTGDERRSARLAIGLQAATTVVGLFPGSREQEVRRLVDPMLGAAAELARRLPTVEFVMPVAAAHLRPRLEAALRRSGLHDRVLLREDGLTVIRASDLVILASGTATLEAALLRVPMIVAYRLSATSHVMVRMLLGAGLLPARRVALPNIILGERVVPEILQGDLTAGRLAAEAHALLVDEAARTAQLRALDSVADMVSEGDVIQRIVDLAISRGGVGALATSMAPPAGRKPPAGVEWV